MNDLDGLGTRYLKRFEAVRARAAERGPDAARTGEVLEAIGAVLRRREVLGVDEAELLRVLRRLDGEEARQWAEGVDVGACEARIVRAAEEALEASLPESAGEGGTWSEWALQGLSSRDDLESALAALEALERSEVMDTSAASGRLGERLRRTDRRLRPKARWFVGLNRVRRAEHELLSAEHRERAWWYAERRGCDELVALLAGELEDSAHLDGCELCQRDLHTSGQVTRRRTRHLSGDELWRYDLGLVAAGERAAIEQHARACAECGRAVRALREGDEAISEMTGDAAAALARAPVTGPVRARTRESVGRVVIERADWKLELRRREGRVLLRVNGRGAFKIGFASASVAGLPPVIRRGEPGGSSGIELDLGEEGVVLGRKVRVLLESKDGRALFDGDVEL